MTSGLSVFPPLQGASSLVTLSLTTLRVAFRDLPQTILGTTQAASRDVTGFSGTFPEEGAVLVPPSESLSALGTIACIVASSGPPRTGLSVHSRHIVPTPTVLAAMRALRAYRPLSDGFTRFPALPF